jgi:hypothetical protein
MAPAFTNLVAPGTSTINTNLFGSENTEKDGYIDNKKISARNWLSVNHTVSALSLSVNHTISALSRSSIRLSLYVNAF